MNAISDLLGPAICSSEVVRAALAQRVLRGWSEIVGPALAGQLTPERYERGVVWIAAAAAPWSQELRMRKMEILDRLNDVAGRRLFEDLRVGVREPARNLAAGE